jgi:hypothetical protein
MLAIYRTIKAIIIRRIFFYTRQCRADIQGEAAPDLNPDIDPDLETDRDEDDLKFQSGLVGFVGVLVKIGVPTPTFCFRIYFIFKQIFLI